jgi:prolyl-tRNA editing enzyme YbaK/EbsC (Cys-tRNA(Pro) deacylase)
VQASVLELSRICINGGRRGFLVGIAPGVLTDVLGAIAVDCAMPA